MDIRHARATDAPAVVLLWRETPDVLPTTTDDEDAVGALLARDPEALLLAEENGRIVGTLIVGWDGWRAGLYRLAVHPDARRRGVATTLVRHAEAALAAKGCRRITATVKLDEDHAMSFWQAAGFTRNDVDGRFVKNVGASE